MRESPSNADGQTTPMKEIDQVDWQSVFFNKSTVFFVRYSCHVDQSRLNSFTSIGGHDCQLLNKLLWCLVSSLISVCFQRFIAIKIAEIFCSNHDVLLSWVEAQFVCFDPSCNFRCQNLTFYTDIDDNGVCTGGMGQMDNFSGRYHVPSPKSW